MANGFLFIKKKTARKSSAIIQPKQKPAKNTDRTANRTLPLNLLAPELFFLNFSTPVYKM